MQGCAMNNQDQVVLREIQKNTHMGMEAIDALMPRVKKEEFARELANQSMMYGEYYEKASNKLKEEENRLYKDVSGKNMMLRGGIWIKTFMNQSTGHMAELVIHSTNRGIMDMYKSLKYNKYANVSTKELAKELMEMQEMSISKMKEYL